MLRPLRQMGRLNLELFRGASIVSARPLERTDSNRPGTNFRDDLAFRLTSTSDKAKPTAPRLHPHAPRLPEARFWLWLYLRAAVSEI
jgi:hypothetical protein